MTPTSQPLAVALLVVALAVPVALAVAWWRAHPTRRTPRRAAAAALVACSVVGAQVALVASAAVLVNRSLGLYTTWGDVEALAQGGDGLEAAIPDAAPQQLSASELADIQRTGWTRYKRQPARGDGQYRLYLVPEPGTHERHHVIVWVPPGYEHATRLTGLRTVYLYNGAYGSVDWFLGAVDPARSAAPLVRSKKLPPFVVVAPEINVDAPGDTECTDYPGGGPQAFTWLAKDVPAWAHHALGVTTDAAHASAIGWSVGGYCAAKVHAALPKTFGAAASMQGFFTVENDPTTGRLTGDLAADPALRNTTDVSWLLAHRGGHPHLLVMTSRADPQSYHQSAAFLAQHAHTPGVWSAVYERAGHSLTAWRGIQPDLWRFLVARTPWPTRLATP